MSFEVFIQYFDRGGPAGVPRAAIRLLFPVVDAESEPDYWTIRYNDLNSCRIEVTPLASNPTLIESLCVFRPCDDPLLWEGLLAVMRLAPAALYFPGKAPPLVVSEAAGEHVPSDMVRAMGWPRVVCSGQEISEAIKRA